MSAWRDIKEHTYVCVTYNDAGVRAKNKESVNGFITCVTETEAKLYFKRYNRIIIDFIVPIDHIQDIKPKTLPEKPAKSVTGGNKYDTISRSELQAISDELARVAELRATIPDDMSRKFSNFAAVLNNLSTDTDKRVNAANQKLNSILDTVDTRFAKHSDIIKAISVEFKTVNARVAKIEAAMGLLNSRITQIADWVRKHN
jgi:hypothetical protein